MISSHFSTAACITVVQNPSRCPLRILCCFIVIPICRFFILPRSRATLGIYTGISVHSVMTLFPPHGRFSLPSTPRSQSLLVVSCLSRLSLNCSQLLSRLSWISLVSKMKLPYSSWWKSSLDCFGGGAETSVIKSQNGNTWLSISSASQLLIFYLSNLRS